MTVTLFGYLILISTDFLRFYFSVFSLVLVWIEKIYQKLNTVFDHISRHLEVRQKYSAAPRIFNRSSRCLETWSNTDFRFDILLNL